MATVNARGQRNPGKDERHDERHDQRNVERNTEAANRALGLSTGWNAFSYLIAGMAAYGLIGWLIGRAVHVALLFPIGMVVGLGISVGWVIYKYGRAAELDASNAHGSKRGDDR